MQTNLDHPLVASTSHVLRTLVGYDVVPVEPHAGTCRTHDVHVVIGLTGRAAGTLVISLSEHAALKLASSMLLVEADRVNDDVVDALGEIAAAIVRGANHETCEYTASLPSVVTGARHRIQFPSNVSSSVQFYATPWGIMRLELALAPVMASTCTSCN